MTMIFFNNIITTVLIFILLFQIDFVTSELKITVTFLPDSDDCKNRKSSVGDKLIVHYTGSLNIL